MTGINPPRILGVTVLVFGTCFGLHDVATIDMDSNKNGCYLQKWLLSVNMVVILKLS